MRRTLVAALAGALVALVIVGGFMALDRTVLHWYAGDDGERTLADELTEEVETAWYYLDESDAVRIASRYVDELPSCSYVLRQYPKPIPAPTNGSPLVTQSEEPIPGGRPLRPGEKGATELVTQVRLAVECKK